MRFIFDSSNTTVKELWFNEYNWLDFYWDAEEAKHTNMPEARGNSVTVSCFIDSNHVVNQVVRRSQTGMFIFLNMEPINWYSKQQSSSEASTFGAEFCAMKVVVEMIKVLRYKLRMFGVPFDGSENVYCDNEVLYKNTVFLE